MISSNSKDNSSTVDKERYQGPWQSLDSMCSKIDALCGVDHERRDREVPAMWWVKLEQGKSVVVMIKDPRVNLLLLNEQVIS